MMGLTSLGSTRTHARHDPRDSILLELLYADEGMGWLSQISQERI